MKLIIVFSSALVLFGCSDFEETYILPMARVLAIPHQYVGENIQVVGFLHPSQNRIFLTRDHSKVDDTASSFYVDDSRLDTHTVCRGKYIAVRGVFGPIDLGDSDFVVGLTSVGFFQDQETLAFCFK